MFAEDDVFLMLSKVFNVIEDKSVFFGTASEGREFLA